MFYTSSYVYNFKKRPAPNPGKRKLELCKTPDDLVQERQKNPLDKKFYRSRYSSEDLSK